VSTAVLLHSQTHAVSIATSQLPSHGCVAVVVLGLTAGGQWYSTETTTGLPY